VTGNESAMLILLLGVKVSGDESSTHSRQRKGTGTPPILVKGSQRYSAVHPEISVLY